MTRLVLVFGTEEINVVGIELVSHIGTKTQHIKISCTNLSGHDEYQIICCGFWLFEKRVGLKGHEYDDLKGRCGGLLRIKDKNPTRTYTFGQRLRSLGDC